MSCEDISYRKGLILMIILKEKKKKVIAIDWTEIEIFTTRQWILILNDEIIVNLWVNIVYKQATYLLICLFLFVCF